jgi:hypothetical protein
LASFFDEAEFRLLLSWDVMRGNVPLRTEKRWHNRSLETPVLIDVYDWTDDRRIFSVLVWPSLESQPDVAELAHFERVVQVKQVLAKGATEQALTTLFETDWDLKWDHERRCWITQDGFAYDGARSTDRTRQPNGQVAASSGHGHMGRLSLSLAAPPEGEASEGGNTCG